MVMQVPEWEEYLNSVLSFVKFKFDHKAIHVELMGHMEGRDAEGVVVQREGIAPDGTRYGSQVLTRRSRQWIRRQDEGGNYGDAGT